MVANITRSLNPVAEISGRQALVHSHSMSSFCVLNR